MWCLFQSLHWYQISRESLISVQHRQKRSPIVPKLTQMTTRLVTNVFQWVVVASECLATGNVPWNGPYGPTHSWIHYIHWMHWIIVADPRAWRAEPLPSCRPKSRELSHDLVAACIAKIANQRTKGWVTRLWTFLGHTFFRWEWTRLTSCVNDEDISWITRANKKLTRTNNASAQKLNAQRENGCNHLNQYFLKWLPFAAFSNVSRVWKLRTNFKNKSASPSISVNTLLSTRNRATVFLSPGRTAVSIRVCTLWTITEPAFSAGLQ